MNVSIAFQKKTYDVGARKNERKFNFFLDEGPLNSSGCVQGNLGHCNSMSQNDKLSSKSIISYPVDIALQTF